MAKYFIFMASILNTRCILDTCRRKKANFQENLRFLKKTKYVGVSCYTFEKQISIILLNLISYANKTSLYPNLHEKSHLSNFWFWNNYHNRFPCRGRGVWRFRKCIVIPFTGVCTCHVAGKGRSWETILSYIFWFSNVQILWFL